MLAYFFNGLGADAPAFAFTHSQVPFRRAPVYLRLTTTLPRALDYAAGGFHVSVDRGSAGGCFDDWSIHKSGTKAATCKQPRNNPAAAGLWNAAASKYLAAYQAASAGADFAGVIGMLREANALADIAYADEGIAPPRDPVTQTTEPPVTKMSLGRKVGIAATAASLLGITTWGVQKDMLLASGGGGGAQMMGARSRRRRRSRR